MARISDRDWTPQKLAALIDERFTPIPAHRVLPAAPAPRTRDPRLTAQEEYARAVAHGLDCGDTAEDFAARRLFLEHLDEAAPVPLRYFGRAA